MTTLSHFTKNVVLIACAIATFISFESISSAQSEALPEAIVPEMPPFPPVVITAGGQRLLLEHTDGSITYDPESGSFDTNKPGWWFINYPVERIANLPSRSVWESWIAEETGQSASGVRNWYFRTKGTAPAEPAAPTGPAPFLPTPNPTRVVNQQHPNASDANPGTMDAPFATINRAISGAKAGDIIHVYPAVYRESLTITQQATHEKPLRIEGIRDADGRMPVITGNDPVPTEAWAPAPGLEEVWRAPLNPGLMLGMASVDMNGENLTLIERGYPDDLKPGEYAFNRGSHSLLETIPLNPWPKAGDTLSGGSWRRVAADSDGYIDLQSQYGSSAGNSIIWLVAHVWHDPSDSGIGWDPNYPAPIYGRAHLDGAFRAGRLTGLPANHQVNPYRIWLNGTRLQTRLYAFSYEDHDAQPQVGFNWGQSDVWNNFVMLEGWNTIVLQLDTSIRPNDLRLRFRMPDDRLAISSATPPSGNTKPSGTARPFVSEFLILDPQSAGPLDNAVYVRLPSDADPRNHQVDVAARGAHLVNIDGQHIHMRGFEIRHGSNYQQTGTVRIAGPANRLEGSRVHSGENRGIHISPKIDSGGPLIVRNNWIYNHGHVGLGGDGRGGAIIDYNVISDYNWGGYERYWEAGGIKIFRMSETTVRHNEVSGRGGPAIWLDWENFQNRVDGNFTHGHCSFGIGVEASPGPNLVANNLSVDMMPGKVWFRAHVLVWDSIRTWSAHNTVNGLGRTAHFWNGTDGNRGLSTQNVTNRGSIFEPFPSNRDTRYFNNIAIGTEDALRIRDDDPRGGNYTDYGKFATKAPLTGPENPLDISGYRPAAIGALGLMPAVDASLAHIRHDFHGLLRFPSDPRVPGAFRVEPAIPDETGGLLEIEVDDATMHRAAVEVARQGYEPSPPIPEEPSDLAPAIEIRRLNDSNVELNWQAWPQMSHVVLERSSDLENWTPLATFSGEASTFSDFASIGTEYYYRLRGTAPNGDHAISHSVGRLLEDWLHNHFGHLRGAVGNENPWDDDADPDGDGVPVLLEYYLDLDPWIPQPEPWGKHETCEYNFRLVYERARFAPDVIGEVRWSRDLRNWSPDGITVEVTPLSAYRERVEATFPRDNSSALFLRLEVRRKDAATPEALVKLHRV